MPLLSVGKLSDLAPNSAMEVMVGPQPYAICNVEGTVTALNGICPHLGGPLGQGQIYDGRIVCPYHLWEFDCRTGVNSVDRARRVATFEVQVDGGEILIQVP